MNAQKSYLTDIGNLYGGILDKVIVEKASTLKTFPKATDKKKTAKNPFYFKKSGPDMKQVPTEAKVEPKFSQATEKTESKIINNCMSKRFDDLYNNVIQDKLQLEADDIETIEDVTAAPEHSEHGGMPGEGEGEAGLENELGEDLTAEELLAKAAEYIAMAQDKLSGGSEGEIKEIEDEAGDSGEEGEEGGDTGENKFKPGAMGEATHLETLPDSKGESLTKKSNKVTGTATKFAKGGKADSKVTDKVGNDGDKGHPLLTGAPKLTKVGGSANQVPNKAKVGYTIGQ